MNRTRSTQESDLPDPAERDRRCLALLKQYRLTRDQRIRNDVVELCAGLAAALARRYRATSESADDLVQVAQLGLLRAAERFDPSRATSFSAFAAATIRGELRHYFRDQGWSMHVPRQLQDLRYRVRVAGEQLCQRERRTPKTGEVAQYLGVEPHQVTEAMGADANYRTASIDHPDRPLANADADADPRSAEQFEVVDSFDAFESLVSQCP